MSRKKYKSPVESLYKDIDYIDDIKQFMVDYKPSSLYFIIYIIFAVFIFSLIFSAYADLDISVKAEGKIIPRNELQTVQSLEPGIIKAIFVKEGDFVKKGQLLLALDKSLLKAVYDKENMRKDFLMAKLILLEAQQQEKKDIIFPPNLIYRRPKMIQDMRHLFYQQKKDYEASMHLLHEDYRLTSKHLKQIMPLVKQRTLSHVEMIELKKEMLTIQSRLINKKALFQQTISNQLHEIRRQYHEILENLKKTEEHLKRTSLRSPVDGLVNQLLVRSQGEVVKSGAEVLSIVPYSKDFLIQVWVSPKDISLLYPGQKAKISVSAYDFSKYGSLEASIVHISPDSVHDNQNGYFYEVKLFTKKHVISHKGKSLKLRPGMTVTANFLVGKESLLLSLLRPVFIMKSRAFHEP